MIYSSIWLKAYDLLQDERYLSMASQIFRDVCSGWDAVCGGGLWWKKDRTYKNAITNELFLTLAARLCQRTHEEQYLAWALKEWNWFLQTGLLNEHHLINDGLTQNCQNNGQPTWTYTSKGDKLRFFKATNAQFMAFGSIQSRGDLRGPGGTADHSA